MLTDACVPPARAKVVPPLTQGDGVANRRRRRVDVNGRAEDLREGGHIALPVMRLPERLRRGVRARGGGSAGQGSSRGRGRAEADDDDDDESDGGEVVD